MDIQLPIMDGYEATRRIKADASLRSIPIIAVTSYALSGEGQKARAAEIERQAAELRKLKEQAASDERVRAELNAAEERHQWDVRVFTERQQSIPLACEVPVLIEQRLFELGRAIRAHMSE